MGAHESLTACQCADPAIAERCGGSLPDGPDCAVNYHFGMMLGVDDFRADQGFHIGRLRRHQRALHGYGVVYGYGVSFDAAKGELRVGPGYALDVRGRDLFLDAPQCLGLPAWWEKHRGDDVFEGLNGEDATFDADVLLCYRTCLSRPVPAIADPCAGTSIDIAYSRICESVLLTLAPRRRGDPPPVDARPAPYHLLRVMLGLDEARAGDAGDEWLATRRGEIAALAEDDRAAATADLWRAAIARAAAATGDPALDAALDPPPDPGDDSGAQTSGCLVIARLSDIRVFRQPDGWRSTVGAIDIDRRMTLLPVQVLQEALLRPGLSITLPGG